MRKPIYTPQSKYAPTTIPSMREEVINNTHPIISDDFFALTPQDRFNIFKHCEAVTTRVDRLGPTSSIELVHSLGEFLRGIDPKGITTAQIAERMENGQ